MNEKRPAMLKKSWISKNFDIEKLFLSPEENAVLSVTDEKLKRKSSNLQAKEASDSDKSSYLALQSDNLNTIPATHSRKLATRIHSREHNSLSKLSPPVQNSLSSVVAFRRKRVSVPPSRLIAEESSLKPFQHNTKNPSQVSPLKRSFRKKIPDMQDNVLNKSIIEEVQNISEAASNSLCVRIISNKKRNRSSELKESIKEELYNDHINENKPCLPEGWSSKAIVRKSGKTAGNVDLYIYSPDGLKFRSKAEIAKYLKRTNSPLNLEDFNISHEQLTKQENVLIPAKTSEEHVEPDNICDSRSKSSDSSALNSRRVSKTTLSKSPKIAVKNGRKSRPVLESHSSGSIFKSGRPQNKDTGGHTEFENHQEATPKTQTQNTEPSENHSLSGKTNEMVAMENISIKLMRCDVDKIVQYEKNYPSAIKAGRRGQKKKFQEKENVIFEPSSEELKNGKEEGNVSGPSPPDSRATRKRKSTPLTISKKIPKRLNNVSKSPESLTATSSSPLLDDDKSYQRDVPEGWMINLVKRKSGKTAGLVDVYIYSPEGLKFRSKPDLAAYLARTKSPLKLEDFSFDKKQITGKSK
ncbi:uncharacterized protein LOC118198053 isoform X2 [Stegodyphus dumicola]|uniref:uncharacterized protein LOC118198053 isoform X2 n=1 Tax=Stegodyphus dumicola TaxID=202533 RepID=UPI0015B20902|nr:uncharacterized protein LOC118198053 isoform X2 [Stegodyphus dumicola]